MLEDIYVSSTVEIQTRYYSSLMFPVAEEIERLKWSGAVQSKQYNQEVSNFE